MWIASARYSLVLVFSSIMGPWLFLPNPGKSNTHVDCGLIYVEPPNCHILGMEVEHVLCLQLLAVNRQEQVHILQSRNDLSMVVKQHSLLMSELWFPYKSIIRFCSGSFNSFCKFCRVLFHLSMKVTYGFSHHC